MKLRFHFLGNTLFSFFLFFTVNLPTFSVTFQNQTLSPNTLSAIGWNISRVEISCQKGAIKMGSLQSPIKIGEAAVSNLAPIGFHYQDIPLTIKMNDFGGIQVDYAPGSFISIEDQKYYLSQFHFHHPGEHSVEGKLYAIEAHLVHQGENGKFVVVAVFITPGKHNHSMDPWWKRMPTKKEKIHDPSVRINANQLLPRDRDYFYYSGSFTTPPYTENVDWYVLKRSIEMSEKQIWQLTAHHPQNSRPTQPLNQRIIHQSS